MRKKKAQKKGIVLLLTLFFISAISVLILQNLDDSESFIKEITYDTQLIQLKITQKNIENELITLINKNKENIIKTLDKGDEISFLPLSFKNIDVFIGLSEYFDNQCNLNKIENENDLRILCDDGDVFVSIVDMSTFLRNLKEYSPITSEQQLLYVIEQYEKKSRDDSLRLMRDRFSYLTTDENERYLQCDFEIRLVDGITSTGQFIFKIGSDSVISSYTILK